MPKRAPKKGSSVVIFFFFTDTQKGFFFPHKLCAVLSSSVLQSAALKCIILTPQKIEVKNSIKKPVAIWKMNRPHLNR